MLQPDATAADNSLSIDRAAALLDEAPITEEKDDTQPDSSAVPTAEESGEPDADPAIVADENADEPEAEELSVIEAPHSWDAESRAKFGALPRDVQELIVAREKERDAGLSRALEETAHKRKEAESAASRIGQYATLLDQLLPQAKNLFQDRWAQIDWAQLPDAIGAEETLKLRLQYENEQQQLGQLQQVQQVLDAEQFGHFVKAEEVELAKRSPELGDTKLGPERKRALAHYLVQQGVPAERLRLLTAYEADIAYKAQKYDALMAKAKAPSNTTGNARGSTGTQPISPAPARTAVRPTAAHPSRSSATQAQQQAKDRFKSSGRIDDAVAYLNARN
ncbi:MAG: hypothetical protein HY243_15925 [Proteobacteria bacterium]|nr:hypothetical protein [Pseudomonadota bacterium]